MRKESQESLLVKIKGSRRRSELSQPIAGYLFIMPAVLGILIFSVIPVIYAFYISFTDYNLLNPIKNLVGYQNYKDLLNDPLFWKSMKNSFYFAGVVVPLQSALALGLAILVNQKIKMRGFFRSAFFVPVVTSMVVASTIWLIMYNPSSGLINSILMRLGLPRQPFLTSSVQAMPAVIVMCIWKSVGFSMVIFLAGLQGIPQELYEAVQIDGAGKWQSFRYITLPLLKRTTLFILVITTMDALKIFSPMYVMTGGGPRHATMGIVFYIWKIAFSYMKMGYASALAFVLFALILILTLLQFRFLGTRVEY